MLIGVPPRHGRPGFKQQRGAREAPACRSPGREGVWEGVWRRGHSLLSPAREAAWRVWASSSRSRTNDKGRGTGFSGSLPRPKLFLPARGGRAERGSGAGEGGASRSLSTPEPRLWDANPDAAWVSVSLNPSPPPPPRLGRGLGLAGGGSGDWRSGRVRLSAGGRGAREAELRAGVGTRIFQHQRARAEVLLASPRCARPNRLRSRLCPRMGWGSWEERAGARAGRAQPLPVLAPAVWALRTSHSSADAPRSRGLAGIHASGPGAGDGRADPESSGHPLSWGGSDHPLAIPRLYTPPGLPERRGSGLPSKPARYWCLGEKWDLNKEWAVIRLFASRWAISQLRQGFRHSWGQGLEHGP